ncbi:hypothetical protein TCSYLVIO_011031 [Trypanosoma cruzi]|nr:hypothetical protein TCSYLVIO_011031 [Trypanosoma cruzi]
MARRLNCEGAVVYGCNEAGVVVRMWKQRSHAYAMERAAQEAIVTHRLCGVALRSRLAGRLAGLPEEVRQRLGDWEAESLDYLVRFAAWLQDLRRRWITLQNQFTQCVAADAHVRSQVMHYEPSPATPMLSSALVRRAAASPHSPAPCTLCCARHGFRHVGSTKTRPAEGGSFLAPFGARSEVATRTLSSTR